jgi:hypothetical protein
MVPMPPAPTTATQQKPATVPPGSWVECRPEADVSANWRFHPGRLEKLFLGSDYVIAVAHRTETLFYVELHARRLRGIPPAAYQGRGVRFAARCEGLDGIESYLVALRHQELWLPRRRIHSIRTLLARAGIPGRGS